MLASSAWPSLEVSRYFLSQISSEASWKGMESTSRCTSFITEFMVKAAPSPAQKRANYYPAGTQDLVVLPAERNQAEPSPSRLLNKEIRTFKSNKSCNYTIIRSISSI